MPLISIITVNYNQPEATIALLKSIGLHYPDMPLEIILVDNGSTKNCESSFLKQRKDIIFIRSEKNLGFAGGNNLGLKAATGEFLFLVNNDTEFLPGLLEQLSGAMAENSAIGIISPKILYFDEPEVLQYAGFTEMNYYTCRNHCIGQFEKDLGQYDNLLKETGFAHGAAMMISRKALDAAGRMAENFFLYYEEMDWCERIKKAGFKVFINTHASIFHKESLSVGKNSALKEYFMNRNRILFIRKNANFFQRMLFYLYFITLVTPRNMFKYLKKGNKTYIAVLFRAIKWNISNKTTSPLLGFTLK
jgi:GT2 family glycosyltransferase